MNKSFIVKNIRKKYIEQYLENAQKMHYTELTEKEGVQKVFYDELPNKEMQGYPTASDMVAPDGTAYSMDEFQKLPENEKKKCRLRFYYLPCSHELYVGTTGSGKTTGCVEPQLRAISSQKNKPNLFLTNPKGELFDRNAKHLQDMGYKLFVLNFKDSARTDKWNPFLEAYDKQMELLDIGKGAVMRKGAIRKGLILAAPPDKFKENYIEYKGRAYPNNAYFEQAKRKERDEISATVAQLVNSLASMFIVVENTRDPSWEYGAQDLLRGLLLCMLEDATNFNSGFTRDMMSIKTMHEYYLALKLPVQSGQDLFEHKLIQNKTFDSVAHLCTALRNAPNTMRSYTGVFDGALKDWLQGHIFSITSNNTIDIDSAGDQPFAIFLITRDYDKSDNLVAGLAIDWVHRSLIKQAESGKNTRPMHFLLDEFGNIPRIKDFDNKISTSRSRKVWFHLFVQSYKQIENVYGEQVAQVVHDNCNTHAFLGSQSFATKKVFSEECGLHTVPSLQSKLQPDENALQEASILPLSQLDLIKPGEIYVKKLGTPLFLAQYIRSYVCENHGIFKKNHNGLVELTPYSLETFSDPKFKYRALQRFLSMEQLDDDYS